MSKNPLLNALSAAGYIILVVSAMTFISKTMGDKPDTFLAPVVFLSMLVLSVTVMAYLFFYQPVQLFISGKKKESIDLFAKTVGVFAVITLVFLILLFTGLI